MKITRAPRFYLCFIFSAAILMTIGLLRAPFLSWDDDLNISSNPYFLGGNWSAYWRAPYYGLYVPIINFIWQTLFVLGGGSALPFRILNALLHGLNTVLAYSLFCFLARRWRINSVWAPLVALGFFAFHPLQLEAIAWISGGRDLLSATFTLVALISYYYRPGLRYAVASFLFFGFAMLAKPNAVALPAVLFLLDWMWGKLGKRTLVTTLAMASLSLFPIWLTIHAQAEHFLEVKILARPWIMLDTYAFYFRKILWPAPLNANYARPPEYVLAHVRTLWVGIAFVIGVAMSLLWAYRRDRRFWIGVLWFVWLLPVSGIVPFGYQRNATVADHYQYLAMIVVGAVTMLLFDHIAAYARRCTLAAVLAVHAALLLAACTRVPVWASNEAFFVDMAAYNPSTFAAGIGMSIVSCVDREDFPAGVAWTEVALRAKPGDMKALANQAYCYLHDKNYIRVVELEMELNKLDLVSVEINQSTAFASFLASVGTAEMELHQYEVGFQYLCQARRIQPDEPRYQQNLIVATRMLVEAKMTPRCDPEFSMAPGEDTEEVDE